MKKNVTYILAAAFETAIQESGLTTSEKSGWIRVDGQNGRRLYVPKTKKVGRVDLVGIGHSASPAGVTSLGEGKFGAVTHQLNFDRSESEVLAMFSALLEELKTAPAVEKPAKEPKAPRERKAKGTEAGTVEAPKASRADRMALIRATAEKHGVAVSPDEETAASEEQPSATWPDGNGHNVSDSQ